MIMIMNTIMAVQIIIRIKENIEKINKGKNLKKRLTSKYKFINNNNN